MIKMVEDVVYPREYHWVTTHGIVLAAISTVRNDPPLSGLSGLWDTEKRAGAVEGLIDGTFFNGA